MVPIDGWPSTRMVAIPRYVRNDCDGRPKPLGGKVGDCRCLPALR